MDAVSLSLNLLTACIQGYRSFQSLRSLGRDARVILCKIEIQEHRLRFLKQEVELSRKLLDLSFLKHPIREAIENIYLLTADTKHLKKQYKLRLPPPDTTSERREEGGSLGSSIRIKRLHVAKWLIFDKDELDRLASDLKVLTDGLDDLLQAASKQTSRPSFPSAWIAALDTEDVSALKDVVEASETTYPDLALAAERKWEHIVAETDTDSLPERTVKAYDQTEFSKPTMQDSQRVTVKHLGTGIMILLEWRNLPHDPMALDRAMNNLKTTSQLLHNANPGKLRTLNCVGYVRESMRDCAALVYRFPTGASRDPPVSLLHMLESTANNAFPSLDDRFTLALRLSQTVFHLHVSGLVHKAINAHNVLFFHQSSWDPSTGPFSKSGAIREPYLSGFEFSRQGTESTGTETVVGDARLDRYRHPSCQGPTRDGFKKKFDLYSLGIVLLEVGCWKAFSAEPEYKDTLSISENRDRILRLYLTGHIAYIVGTRYQEVIRTCLTGNFGSDELGEAAFQQYAYDKVLKPLESLSIS